MALPSPNDSDANELSPHNGKTASPSMSKLTASDSYNLESLEFSAPLETSVPLEAPRWLSRALPNPAVAVSLNRQTIVPLDKQGAAIESASEMKELPNVVNEATIPLLEERLVIDRHRRKVGEVVVRKEIETYIVEVPVRREKLIVEQISPTYKQLAVVDLGKVQLPQDDSFGASLSQTASAKFTSATAAIEFIEAIAADSNSNMVAIQVSIVLVDENLQTAYQQWLEQHTKTV